MKTTSWVIVEKDTKKPIFETFNEKTANAINSKRYTAIPILEYLQAFNQGVKTKKQHKKGIKMENTYQIQSDVTQNGDQYWFIWDYKNNDFVPSEFQSFDSFEQAQAFLDQLQAA